MVSMEMLFRLLFACIMVFALGCVLGAFVMAVEHFFYERARHKKVLEAIETITKEAVADKQRALIKEADKQRALIKEAYKSGKTHADMDAYARMKGEQNNVGSESKDE